MAKDKEASTGYAEFEFDLPSALLVRLLDVFGSLESQTLDQLSASLVPDQQGVYQLYLDDQLVYVGKTDGDAGLRSRLARHAVKLMDRRGLDPARVSFKAVRVFVFTAMDLEGDLIRHYGGTKSLSWNGSGFGSNDPGKERDTTVVKVGNFDAQFPINIDKLLDRSIGEGETAATVLSDLKAFLPFTVRFQNLGGSSRKPHRDLSDCHVPSLSGPLSARQILAHVVAQLPAGWHATALPGYVIMYKNDRRTFPSGEEIAKSP